VIPACIFSGVVVHAKTPQHVGTTNGMVMQTSQAGQFLGPILLMVFTIGAGTRAIAGEEESQTLDVLLSMPIRRRRVVFDKFVAMLGTTASLVAVVWVAILVFGPMFQLEVDLGNLTAACLSLYLLAVGFGTIAIAVGAATGSKGLAVGVPAAAALVTFILNVLGPSVEALKPFRKLSPFYYYWGAEPLRNGLDVGHALVLAAIPLVTFLVALIAFERRDLAA